MPIKVSCKCGQSFMAKDDLEGQTLLCPKCHQPLTIHANGGANKHHEEGLDEILEEVGLKEYAGPRCPRCQAPMKPNAVICVECGYNLQTGEVLPQPKIHKAGERGHGEAAEVLLERAAERIQEEKLEEKKMRKQGLPAWVLFLALAGLTGFAVSMFLIPRDRAFLISGGLLAGAGYLYATYCQIRILINAFRESVVCGLLYLFLPLYPLYYIFTRWDQCGGLFLLSILGNIIGGMGYIMMLVSPNFAESKQPQDAEAWLQPASTIAVCSAATSDEWARLQRAKWMHRDADVWATSSGSNVM